MTDNSPDSTYSGDNNPIEITASLAESKGYTCTRQDENNLNISVMIKGKELIIDLVWQEEFAALVLSGFIPLEIDDNTYEATVKILETINKNIWLGHFDLSGYNNIKYPTFRHTLLCGMLPAAISISTISDIIDISISECERFYDTFKQAKEGDVRLHDSLDAIVFETIGEA